MTSPLFVAIDVETTLNGNEEVGLAQPMHPDNRVVLYGITNGLGVPFTTDKPKDFKRAVADFIGSDPTYCGHNISFDLLYLYKESPALKEVLQTNKIWDTQLAEYILTGQRSKWSSLDELSIKYGLPVKDDKIKAYFQAGLGSDKIPREELDPYLKQDLENTFVIANLQYKEAEKNGQLTLILSQMEALHATTEMMFNGLCIDKEALEKYTVEVVNEYVDVKCELEVLALARVDDINSPKQWSQFFFGGVKKVKVKEEVGVYKNGNTKYKLVEKSIKLLPFIKYTPDPEKVSAKTGQVSVDDAVLNDMLKHTVDAGAIRLINQLLKYRELSKQLSTYVQGLSKHIIGDVIHGKLNHTATVTGRLSSTSPNLQNISNNPIKQIFVSRFKDGLMVEVDFNQLEVVALAHVTKDKQLIKDIGGGADIHSELYKDMFGKYPTKEERKPFKARTFQLIYGAGAKAISKQAGCSLEEAKKFIDVFYSRYPQVADWHKNFAAEVERNAKYLKGADGLMEKVRTYTLDTETGRKFSFTEYHNESTWSTRTYNFSPTELKNYPVQGLATGDIVPMMLGIIFRKLVGREDVKMVNTIHDSLMFDVKGDSAVNFILEITDTLKDTHKYFLEIFKKPLSLKLNAGASFGPNWYNMEEM
ncbi:PolA DNA polymerase I - 3'-5' exonuclease and polymerase domains [uncultured Caudovirales phage]|uniref:PolA DNA polymerase I - 3'-5' exonuclease and polymerase domains n=1 Tax=uncultured Caudovirales phage TaxID=2100421 RepID=A0A6J5T814_9CAUD|nr:PolA DNA polymerase I - 3'-5' exonuclease and polymerase domains [uncultured Caudovirales phage]